MGDMYHPSGQLQGVTDAFPDRGTSSGFLDDVGGTQTDGREVGAIDATNSLGSIASYCRSDAPGEENVNDEDAGNRDTDDLPYA